MKRAVTSRSVQHIGNGFLMGLVRAMAAVLLIGLAASGAAQQAQSTADEDVAVSLADSLMDLERQLNDFRGLQKAVESADGERKTALMYREDQRALELLELFVTASRQVVDLPDDATESREFLDMLTTTNAVLDEAFKNRFHQLEARIDQTLTEASGLSGVERIATEALVEGLNGQRLRYVSSMIDVVELRQQLSLPAGELSTIARQSLAAYSQELMGEIELGAATKSVMAEQLAVAGDSADLKMAIETERQNIERAGSLLERVVDEMDRLEMDTSHQRRVLLKQASALTVSLVDVDVLTSLLADFSTGVEAWLKAEAFDFIVQALLFLAILLGSRYLARFVRAAVRRGLEAKGAAMSQLLQDVLISMVGLFVLTIGFLVALSQVGISVAPMLAGLGVAGFIIGFALQDTLSNFAAGAMILAYRPFDTDDYIQVAGVEGIVKKMNMVSTTINTIDNQTLIIPNSKIWGDVIRNYTGQRVRRVDLEFGISYSDDVEKAERVLHEIVDNIPAIMRSPEPIIRLHRLGESSVDFIVRPWVKTEDYWETRWALHKAVKIRFDAENISIPFPQRDIHHYYEETPPEQS